MNEDRMRISGLLLGPDERVAAEALGSLSDPRHFMERVSSIPLVERSISSIGSAYEATKNVSNIVRFSAETVESKVKSISKPVIDTVAPALAPLNRFACSQLDILEKSFPSIMSTPRTPNSPQSIASSDIHNISPSDAYMTPPFSQPSRPASPNAHSSIPQERNQVSDMSRKPRSRWQTVVSGVGNNIGAMVISDEVIRALKHCLEWIQVSFLKINDEYAAAHIQQQIRILRQNIHEEASHGGVVSKTNSEFMEFLSKIRREIVETVRNVVDIIGKYAAIYLPMDARQSVRGFILGLPSRWASVNNHEEQSDAEKVLKLASESSDMLHNIESVFSQAVEMSR